MNDSVFQYNLHTLPLDIVFYILSFLKAEYDLVGSRALLTVTNVALGRERLRIFMDHFKKKLASYDLFSPGGPLATCRVSIYVCDGGSRHVVEFDSDKFDNIESDAASVSRILRAISTKKSFNVGQTVHVIDGSVKVSKCALNAHSLKWMYRCTGNSDYLHCRWVTESELCYGNRAAVGDLARQIRRPVKRKGRRTVRSKSRV